MLVDTPVFLSSAQWGTVNVADAAILPSTSYGVRADVRDVGSPPNLSAAVVATTWQWGDLNNMNDVDLFDIVSMLDAFQDIFVNATLESSDLRGDVPNRDVDLFDIVAVLDAFQDLPYPGIACASQGGVSASMDGTATAVLAVVPRRRAVGPGARFSVDVYVRDVADLRGYQLQFSVDGAVKPVTLWVDTSRSDYVFREVTSYPVASQAEGRLASVALAGGVPVRDWSYLGSGTFAVSKSARSQRVRQLGLVEGTILVDSENEMIMIKSSRARMMRVPRDAEGRRTRERGEGID
jgi:hypothetical protein